MGAGNVMLVSHHWADLPANPYKILVRMALVILDDTDKPRWWGGDGPLLDALGRSEVSDGSPEGDRALETGDVLLRRAIRHLVKAGALEYAVRPVKGRRAEYWVHWMPEQTVPAYGTDGSGMGNKLFSIPEQSVGAKEERGGLRIRDENRSPQVTTSPGPADDSGAPDRSLRHGLCPHGQPDVWHGINHGCRHCRKEGR